MRLLRRWTVALAIMSLVACQPPEPPPTPTHKPVAPPGTAVRTAPTVLGFAWDDRTPFRTGLIASEQSVLGQLNGASVYQMDLQIADDLLALEGQQAVRYTNQETEPLEEIYLRLFPNLYGRLVEIHDVRVDDQEVTPTYELADSALRVPLSPALQPGGYVVIEVTFSVQLPEGGGNYGTFGLMDGILTLAHAYPMIAVYDDEGWNIEIPPEQGDVVYADSSFYLVQVTAPARLSIVASGIEVERQVTGGRQQATYAGGPMRDFYLAASSRYTVLSERVGQTSVNSYAPAELREGAQAALRHTVNALRVFGERFGVYPFTELDVVSTATGALGVEYPGIVAMAQRLYPPDTEYSPAYLEGTMAHEVAHQWFYSVIGNDQVDEPWLDEALAQYATLLYWQDLYGSRGGEGFRGSLIERWERVDNADIPIGMPVRAYEGKEYGAIVYGRGPLFVEALAKRMGQKTFAAFLRDYYETFKWGIATTEGLKQLAESHCSSDLTPLFEQWVYER
jgi:hypothetical protein